jgi:hypothetical protein
MRIVIIVLLIAAAGCAALRPATTDELRDQCDRLAVEATEAASLDEARQLATRAAECYAELQGQRR